MKFCQAHWEEAKQAIKSRGLFDLVAADKYEAFQQMVDELKGEEKTVENFDPLMTLHWMIVGRATEIGGLYLLTQKPDGTDYCPVCEAESHGFHGWINSAANAVAEMAKNLPKKT